MSWSCITNGKTNPLKCIDQNVSLLSMFVIFIFMLIPPIIGIEIKNMSIDEKNELCTKYNIDLSKDKIRLVRMGVANNDKTPSYIRCNLINLMSANEIKSLITEENLSSENLLLLQSKTKNKSILKLIREHKNFPTQTNSYHSAKEKLFLLLNKLDLSNEKMIEASNMISVFEDSIRGIVE